MLIWRVKQSKYRGRILLNTYNKCNLCNFHIRFVSFDLYFIIVLQVPNYPVAVGNSLRGRMPGPNEIEHRLHTDSIVAVWMPAMYPHMDPLAGLYLFVNGETHFVHITRWRKE
jgi:hypothetical protein